MTKEFDAGGWSIIERIADDRIQRAIDEGAFDNLPGKGKPLDLEDDSWIPHELRMAYKLLKNAGFAVPEVDQRKTLSSLADALPEDTAAMSARNAHCEGAREAPRTPPRDDEARRTLETTLHDAMDRRDDVKTRYRQIHKFQVLLGRFRSQRGGALQVDEDSNYFDKIIKKTSLQVVNRHSATTPEDEA